MGDGGDKTLHFVTRVRPILMQFDLTDLATTVWVKWFRTPPAGRGIPFGHRSENPQGSAQVPAVFLHLRTRLFTLSIRVCPASMYMRDVRKKAVARNGV
jgi:hypothetical protein